MSGLTSTGTRGTGTGSMGRHSVTCTTCPTCPLCHLCRRGSPVSRKASLGGDDLPAGPLSLNCVMAGRAGGVVGGVWCGGTLRDCGTVTSAHRWLTLC
ncbi:hypothetical protein E2C01_040470 [Portunus trituberculatus]|uniref:Uncharacterized protein n=1 Tax=Portunus trituberculatus TaxID=210409 RepID=A0A5B7FQV4_PORTR|nr:hypothetical protein [Portunus trituberculatus]